MRFQEIADRVYLAVEPSLAVNVTLVVGGERALLVDTLSTREQAAELGEAVRAVTGLPLALLNTHFHFDHVFGNQTLSEVDTPIYGHPHCVEELRDRGDHWRRIWQDEFPELGPALAEVEIVPPNHEVAVESAVDLGGRQVQLWFLGRGHTSGDLVAGVDDVIIAGDLVEEGGPWNFSEAYPLEWPETVGNLVRLTFPMTRVIPGHGALLGHDEVKQQHDELTRLDWMIREGHADGASVEEVAKASSLAARWGNAGLAQARFAVQRGYAHLA